MNILVSSVVDIANSAPNRIHHFVCRLAAHHSVKIVSIKDNWKSKRVKYNDLDMMPNATKVCVEYPANISIGPVVQEIISPLLLRLKKVQGNFDIHLNYNSLLLGAALQSISGSSLPVIYDLADDLEQMIRTSPQLHPLMGMLGGRIGAMAIKKNIERAKYVTYTCHEIKESFNILSSKAVLLPNGVDTNLFNYKIESIALRKKIGLENAFVFGYVGVLREWVDFDIVFRVMLSLPKTKLIIVGAEGNVNKIKNTVKDMGLQSRVIFTGNVLQKDVPKLISCMDLALIPFKENSVTKNALPLKLFEYISCKCPVVSSNLPAVKRAVGNTIFYMNNERDLENIIKYMQNNTEYRSKVEQGFRIVNSEYSWDSIVARLEKLMLKCVEK